MSDFTAGSIHSLPVTTGSTGDPEFDKRLWQLIEEWGCDHAPELIQEMMITALRMARDEMPVADLKLINRALKEMRHAGRVFSDYSHRRKIAVFGSARTPPEAVEFQAAVEFSKRMKDLGYMVITGAGDGIMGAAQQGAGREESFGLNIKLPFEQQANEVIRGDRKLITFNYFFTRKLTFVKETDAVALFPGGFGTMDEGFECLTLMQTGKACIIPLVMVDRPGGSYWERMKRFLEEDLLANGLISPEDFSLFHITHDLDEAVEQITRFYKIFHSYRYVGKRLVLRLNEELAQGEPERLTREFSDLLKPGKPMEQRGALKAELDETDIVDLPRLVVEVERNRFGRIRELIDAVNQSKPAPGAEVAHDPMHK